MTDSRRSCEQQGARPGAATRARLIAFLTSRLTEDLARIWPRSEQASHPESRPGAAAQVAIVDELLRVLALGRLPTGRDLRLLLYGYGHHPDYDPDWSLFLPH